MHPEVELIHEELRIRYNMKRLRDSFNQDYVICYDCKNGGIVPGSHRLSEKDRMQIFCPYCQKSGGVK